MSEYLLLEERKSMKDFSKFATDEFPLRASGLQALVKCPWRVVSLYLVPELKDEAGAAADTGSATHAAVQTFHQSKDVVASVEAMHGRRDEYPQANLDDAAKLFLAYSEDPRNARAEVVFAEQRVKFEIAPHPQDPTQAPIKVIGRLDQVRFENGEFRLYDLKTSTREGPVLMAEAWYQVAAYCVGATVTLGKPVQPGALILARKYFRRGCDPKSAPAGVFWNYVFNLQDCDTILQGVRSTVAEVRSGRMFANAGDYCAWCAHGGIDACLPRLVQLGKS